MATLVTSTVTFEAAHQLPWHPGRCRRLHGHHYRCEVTVTGPLDERGIVVDFEQIDEILATAVTDRFDHQLLNDILSNPTAELIAAEIWESIAALLPAVTAAELVRLRLFETPESYVELVRDSDRAGHGR
jgi:6-pyruvoyltetrahydropterin/6-carboxytetrahydropterin synthase